jgi:hypothetical protein
VLVSGRISTERDLIMPKNNKKKNWKFFSANDFKNEKSANQYLSLFLTVKFRRNTYNFCVEIRTSD